MSRKPLGDTAMSVAERSRRKRAKAKAMRLVPGTPGKQHQDIEVAAGVDYPRMLYHRDGRTTIAATPEQHQQLKPEGWGTIPLAVHQQRPVSSHGTNYPFVWPVRRW